MSKQRNWSPLTSILSPQSGRGGLTQRDLHFSRQLCDRTRAMNKRRFLFHLSLSQRERIKVRDLLALNYFQMRWSRRARAAATLQRDE
jgi:hypothetical protein